MHSNSIREERSSSVQDIGTASVASTRTEGLSAKDWKKLPLGCLKLRLRDHSAPVVEFSAMEVRLAATMLGASTFKKQKFTTQAEIVWTAVKELDFRQVSGISRTSPLELWRTPDAV